MKVYAHMLKAQRYELNTYHIHDKEHLRKD